MGEISSLHFNVVSLMDIFTILVFFLLVNTNEITPLPNPKGIEMPESISEVTPQESVVVMLSKDAVRASRRRCDYDRRSNERRFRRSFFVC